MLLCMMLQAGRALCPHGLQALQRGLHARSVSLAAALHRQVFGPRLRQSLMQHEMSQQQCQPDQNLQQVQRQRLLLSRVRGAQRCVLEQLLAAQMRRAEPCPGSGKLAGSRLQAAAWTLRCSSSVQRR